MNTQRPDFSNVRTGTSSEPAGTPDFSNVRGGTSAVQGGGGTGTPAAGRGSQQYTVERGDTLSHIAKHFYGKAGRWRAIFDANRDQLDDPDLIRPGQVLTIPPLDDND
jgi:nucleoid-associated protein YgaU